MDPENNGNGTETNGQAGASSSDLKGDILKGAAAAGLTGTSTQPDTNAGTSNAQGTDAGQSTIDFKNADNAKKFMDPDDPSKNLYNVKREYQRKAETLRKSNQDLSQENAKLKAELESLKGNGDINKNIERMMRIQQNPEILEFEKVTPENFSKVLGDDADKMQRYLKWQLDEKERIEKEKNAAYGNDKDEGTPPAEQTNNFDKIINDGAAAIKERYGVEVTSENVKEFMNKMTVADAYKLSLLEGKQYEKVLSKEQMLDITKATVKRLEAERNALPPHDATASGSASAAGAGDPNENIGSYSDLAKLMIKNAGSQV